MYRYQISKMLGTHLNAENDMKNTKTTCWLVLVIVLAVFLCLFKFTQLSLSVVSIEVINVRASSPDESTKSWLRVECRMTMRP